MQQAAQDGNNPADRPRAALATELPTLSPTKKIARRKYGPIVKPCPLIELPFVKDLKVAPRKTRRSFWAVERTTDYPMACDKGLEFAAHYLQFIKDGNAGHGLRCWIATEMAKADDRATDP